jgi:1,4-dihydroxy-2-naphthoate octaprenyltransferase
MDLKNHPMVLFMRLSRIDLILADSVMGLVGAGIARYLNHLIEWPLFWLGIAWVIAVQLGGVYLNQYFSLEIESDLESHTRYFSGNPVLGSGEGKLPRGIALNLGLVSFAIGGALTVILIRFPGFGIASGMLMALALIGVVTYSLPPLHLARSGFGELLVASFFGYLIHAFIYSLQTGEIHRLVNMVAVPVILLMISAQLALSFPHYATDQKHNRANMLQRIGWQNGMMVHNTLILLAYLSLAGAAVIGFPRSVGLRAVWTFPLAFVPVWLMGRIAAGAKPVWSALRFSMLALLSVMVFSFLISFWM